MLGAFFTSEKTAGLDPGCSLVQKLGGRCFHFREPGSGEFSVCFDK
jgi:hypothetical protein